MTEVTSSMFGITQNGSAVLQFTLRSGSITAKVIEYGANLTNLYVPDREGHSADVVLGFDTLGEYEKQNASIGATVGRYANRISGASFELNHVRYNLYANNGSNHLHGGKIGFEKRVWRGEPVEDGVRLSLHSPDMEEGYPGNLDVSVTYTLKNDCLSIHYEGISDRDTIVSLTNHSYFNLSGDPKTDIVEHLLQINASLFCLCDKTCMVTGEIVPVEDTPFDFRLLRSVGSRINDAHPQIAIVGGYDHNFALDENTGEHAALLIDPLSGRKMEVTTDMPAVQLYTSNSLIDVTGKDDIPYHRHNSLCLETQHYPDAINKKNFPSPILRAGEKYDHITTFRFSVL